MTTPQQAYEAGAWARENGRAMDACPHYAMGEPGYLLRKAWREGWVAADRRMLREVAER